MIMFLLVFSIVVFIFGIMFFTVNEYRWGKFLTLLGVLLFLVFLLQLGEFENNRKDFRVGYGAFNQISYSEMIIDNDKYETFRFDKNTLLEKYKLGDVIKFKYIQNEFGIRYIISIDNCLTCSNNH